MNAVLAMSPDAAERAERQHLVWVARHAAAPSGSPFVADTSTQLLRTIAEVLDIRSVFSRVSRIVKHFLPHEALALKFSYRAGNVTLEGSFCRRSAGARVGMNPEDRDFSIVSDLRRARSRFAACWPDIVDVLVAAGYRSILRGRSVAQAQVSSAATTLRTLSRTRAPQGQRGKREK
jgi:hypothetical protein